MNLREARIMVPGLPKKGRLGVTIKLMRKQNQMITRRLKKRLWQVTTPLRET